MAEMNYFFSNPASRPGENGAVQAQNMTGQSAQTGAGTARTGASAAAGQTGVTQPADPGTVLPVYPETSAGGGNSGGNGNDYGISLPVAPPDSPPVAPLPSTPSVPDSSPGFPIFPNFPGTGSTFSETRFLVAATNNFPLRLSVDSSVYDTAARFGTVTGHGFVADGFHTVTVRRASDLRAILFQKSFPFRAGEKTTLVVIDSGQGGMDVIQVSDSGCRNFPAGAGGYRVANMSFDGSSYNVQLQGAGTIFRNVNYTSVTPFKQAMQGSYLFTVTGASCCGGFRELPIIAIGVLGAGSVSSNSLLSVPVDIQAGKSYTTYIIGNNWSDFSLRAVTLES